MKDWQKQLINDLQAFNKKLWKLYCEKMRNPENSPAQVFGYAVDHYRLEQAQETIREIFEEKQYETL